MTDSIVITRQATLMADWSCYVDDVLHQDPEVAAQEGYDGVLMPEGGLSVAAVEPGLVDLDLLRAGRLRRRWVAPVPATGDDAITVAVEKEAGSVTTTFTAADGSVVGVERLDETDPVPAVTAPGPITFRTGPIDVTRIRALVWSIGCLRGEPGWRWGEAPQALTDRAVGLVLPTIVSGRAATGSQRWSRRVAEVSCQPTGAGFPLGARLEAVVGSPDAGSVQEVLLFADSALVSRATVVVHEKT